MSELSVIEFVTCPGCDSPALPSSTVCGECGEHLTPPPVEVVTRYRSHDDDCSCTRCTLELYDSGRAL